MSTEVEDTVHEMNVQEEEEPEVEVIKWRYLSNILKKKKQVTNEEVEQPESKASKKRKKSSKLPVLPKRRTITRKTLKSAFENDETTLLETIQEMVQKELLPKKDNINLKKANIDTLVQYIPDYSTANVLKYALEVGN